MMMSSVAVPLQQPLSNGINVYRPAPAPVTTPVAVATNANETRSDTRSIPVTTSSAASTCVTPQQRTLIQQFSTPTLTPLVCEVFYSFQVGASADYIAVLDAIVQTLNEYGADERVDVPSRLPLHSALAGGSSALLSLMDPRDHFVVDFDIQPKRKRIAAAVYSKAASHFAAVFTIVVYDDHNTQRSITVEFQRRMGDASVFCSFFIQFKARFAKKMRVFVKRNKSRIIAQSDADSLQNDSRIRLTTPPSLNGAFDEEADSEADSVNDDGALQCYTETLCKLLNMCANAHLVKQQDAVRLLCELLVPHDDYQRDHHQSSIAVTAASVADCGCSSRGWDGFSMEMAAAALINREFCLINAGAAAQDDGADDIASTAMPLVSIITELLASKDWELSRCTATLCNYIAQHAVTRALTMQPHSALLAAITQLVNDFDNDKDTSDDEYLRREAKRQLRKALYFANKPDDQTD